MSYLFGSNFHFRFQPIEGFQLIGIFAITHEWPTADFLWNLTGKTLKGIFLFVRQNIYNYLF